MDHSNQHKDDSQVRNADHFVLLAIIGHTTKRDVLRLSRLESDAVGHVQPYVSEHLSRVNLESRKKSIDVLKLAYAEADLKDTARRVTCTYLSACTRPTRSSKAFTVHHRKPEIRSEL